MAHPDSAGSRDLTADRTLLRNPFEETLGQLVAKIRAGELPAGSRLPLSATSATSSTSVAPPCAR